jgi:hypothetical protein
LNTTGNSSLFIQLAELLMAANSSAGDPLVGPA